VMAKAGEMPLLVLYGSATGCAQEVAERIGREGRRRGLAVKGVLPMDAFPAEDLSEEPLVVFVCATTGQGDPPANMQKAWRRLLQKAFPPLLRLRFAVFGLGDSSYAQFNFVAKKLHNRLTGLGAAALVPRGLGDDQDDGGLDKELAPWLNTLWPAIATALPDPDRARLNLDPPNTPLPPESIVDLSSSSSPERGPFAVHPDQRHRVTIRANVRLTAADHFQDVRHVELAFRDDPPPSYEPGDVVGIVSANPAEEVAALMARMHWDPATVVRVRRAPSTTVSDAPAHHGRWLTLRDLCTFFLDFLGTPRRYWFEVLAHHATNEDQRERLAYFGSAEGSEDMHSYCHKEKRSYLETLQDFPSVDLPLEWFVDGVPCLRPRLFSISSAAVADPRALSITMGVVEFTTPYKRVRRGLCTAWLAQAPVGTPLTVLLRSGDIALPPPATPIIMVGPGTGVAPFRAFMQQRAMVGDTQNVLFFGSRYRAKDYLYHTELEEWSQAGKLHLSTAFSRDQPTKVYVQHRIAELSKRISDLIVHRDAVVYIAGNAKNMPGDVMAALQDALCHHQGLDTDEAERYVAAMRRTHRLQLDTWA